MKIKVTLLILLVLGTHKAFSFDLNASHLVSKNTEAFSAPVIINNNDSIIFDLASATITATYIDVPLYIKSDDVISSFDFAMKFNLSKLTYSTTIDLLTTDPTIISSAYFNPNDLFLRYTSSSLQSYPSNGNVYATKIRFSLNTVCVPIIAAEFTDILTILNGTQCSYRVTNLNFSQFIPAANFTTGATCTNADIQFTDVSTVGNGSISAWSWSFDNGVGSILQNPLVSYTSTGAASATLIVTSSSGCQDTLVNSLNVNLPPIAAFTYSADCIKDSVFFTNASTIGAGTIVNSLWDFGDASGVSSLTSPAYHYNASGLYTVTLLSTSNFSCTSAATLVVSLTNKVSANFSLTSTDNCLGSLFTFSDASTYSLNIINAWAWDFGNGSNSSQQNPDYTYPTPGSYSVTLTSTSADGCKGFITKTVTVNEPPVVQFGVTSSTSCAGSTASFTNLSTSPTGSSYLWNFGNGTGSGSQNPVYSFTVSGTFQVKLVVTTPAGCSDSLSTPFSVNFPEPPPAIFTETIVANGVVAFSNVTPNSKRVNWDFGDTRSSIANDPVHTFPRIETYKVCLTSYDSLNCISSSCKDIYVGFAKIVAVPSAFTPNKDNVNDVLKVKGGPLLEMEFQIFNEWGNLLFSSSSQDQGWDGNFKGDPQPVGVYEYILNGKTQDNQLINIYGAVNLTR